MRVRVRVRGDLAVEQTVLHAGDTSLDLGGRRVRGMGHRLEPEGRRPG